MNLYRIKMEFSFQGGKLCKYLMNDSIFAMRPMFVLTSDKSNSRIHRFWVTAFLVVLFIRISYMADNAPGKMVEFSIEKANSIIDSVMEA